jgi:hypothetical protein
MKLANLTLPDKPWLRFHNRLGLGNSSFAPPDPPANQAVGTEANAS